MSVSDSTSAPSHVPQVSSPGRVQMRELLRVGFSTPDSIVQQSPGPALEPGFDKQKALDNAKTPAEVSDAGVGLV